MFKVISRPLCTAGLLALCACGGGGGGTGSGTSGADDTGSGERGVDGDGDGGNAVSGGTQGASGFNGFSQVAPNDTATLTGEALLADITLNADLDITDISNLGRGDATVELVYRDGRIVGIRGEAPGLPFVVSTDAGDILFDDVPGNEDIVVGQDGSGNIAVVFYKADLRGFEYQSLAAWRRNDAQGSYAITSVGAPTPVADVPTSGSASYTGTAVGLSDIDGTVSETEAIVAATTDFSTVNLSVTGTERVDIDTDARTPVPDHDVSGTLTVSGNGFSGPVKAGVGSGEAFGTFFGPQAAELGGFFGVEGARGQYIGAFGAAR